MSDANAFIAAIIAAPDDDGPRLVFADWLDEHDQGERAEFLRVQIEEARLKVEHTKRFNDETDWNECTETSAMWCPNCGDCTCEEPEYSRNDRDCPLHGDSMHGCAERYARKIAELAKRAEELISERHAGEWSNIPEELHEPHTVKWGWERGFVNSIEFTWPDCRDYLDRLLTLQPFQEVTLTTWPALSLVGPAVRVQRNEHEPHIVSTDNNLAEGALRLEWPKIKKWTLPPDRYGDVNSQTHWFADGANNTRYSILSPTTPIPRSIHFARDGDNVPCFIRIGQNGLAERVRYDSASGFWIPDQQQPRPPEGR